MARSLLCDVANQLAMEVQGEGRVYIRIRKRRCLSCHKWRESLGSLYRVGFGSEAVIWKETTVCNTPRHMGVMYCRRSAAFLFYQDSQFPNQAGKKFGRCVIYGNLTLPFETHGNLLVCLDLYEYESVSGLLLGIHRGVSLDLDGVTLQGYLSKQRTDGVLKVSQ
jgi:hypothetical protein